MRSGEPDHRHRRLLRARDERPCCRTADQRNNLTALDHSITSSARASSGCGTSKPSARAVLRLITSSNWVGSWIGRSPGFSPLRMRPAYNSEQAIAVVDVRSVAHQPAGNGELASGVQGGNHMARGQDDELRDTAGKRNGSAVTKSASVRICARRAKADHDVADRAGIEELDLLPDISGSGPKPADLDFGTRVVRVDDDGGRRGMGPQLAE